MRTASILLLEYRGHGRVRFYNHLDLEGTFSVKLYAGGICTMDFSFVIHTQINQFRLFSELVYADAASRGVSRENFEASFTGACDDGGIITASWMSLDNMHNDFTRINITTQTNPITGEREANPIEAIRNTPDITGTTILNFIIVSEVQINYEYARLNDKVSTFAGITNFIFKGTGSLGNRRTTHYSIANALIISVNNKYFEFINVPQYSTYIELLSYDDFMKQLKSKQSDVTCECISIQKFGDVKTNRDILYKILYILSFATCNWLTTLYEYTYKNKKKIRTILFPHKTFPFIGGQYAINPTSNNDAPIRRLVESGYDAYSQLEELLGFKFLIEDYIMSPREGNLEARYLLLAIAMETLASYANGLAERNNTKIANEFRSEKVNRVLRSCKSLHLSVPDQLIEDIVKIGGYNDLRLRDKLNYIFNVLNLTYDKKEISNLVKYRNTIVHAGISKDSKIVSEEWQNLANLFDRFMLTILGWRGNPYIDKCNDYAERILD